jgi:hypothetical protein
MWFKNDPKMGEYLQHTLGALLSECYNLSPLAIWYCRACGVIRQVPIKDEHKPGCPIKKLEDTYEELRKWNM